MEAPIKRSPQQQSLSSSMPAGSTPTQQQLTTTRTTVSDVVQKSMVLEKFASLLGTTNHHRTKDLLGLLSKTVNDDQVVLMVPSLDLQFTAEGGEQHGIKDILPQMGRHNSIGALSSQNLKSLDSIHEQDETMDSLKLISVPTAQRPNMAASVLNMKSTSSSSSSNSVNQPQQLPKLDADTVDSSIQSAAQNIGKQTSWTKSTLPYATNAVGTNITESFTTLFNSRLRAWTLILLRHSLSTGSTDSRAKLLGMLSAKINIQSHEFYYRTLPLPEAAKNAKPIDSDIILPLLFEVTLNISIQEKPEKVVLRAPGTISGTILFVAIGFFNLCDVQLLSNQFSCFAISYYHTYHVTIGIVDELCSPLLLKKVNVQLDTGVFLKSMVDQARMIVLKAVSSATATQIPSTSSALASKMEINATTDSLIVSKITKPLLPVASRDEQSISIPKRTTAEQERMQKARKSAFRLNSVLHGKPLKGSVSSITLGSSGSGGNTSGLQNDQSMRKVTSIRWDNSVQNPKFTSALTLSPNISIIPGSDRKRNKLESFKSFGRPHGGDFGSGPRNATFGEYGRPAFAGAWGRDGRLAAHPMPSKNAAVDAMGNLVGGSADLNATFDNVVIPNSGKKRGFDSTQYLSQGMDATTAIGAYRSSAASAGAALLGRLSNPPPSSSSSSSGSTSTLQQLSQTRISEPNLQRTATALESSLMKKWS